MRIYQSSIPQSGSFQLDARATHYLANVLRANINDPLTLFDGLGNEYAAVITSITKKTIVVDILSFQQRSVESNLNIILAQGIARGEKMDFIIQKAVELGVTTIIPLVTERSNVRLEKERSEKRLQHWHSIMISACEQSGRNYLPNISSPTTLSNWLPHCQADQRFVLTPHESNKLSFSPARTLRTIAILLGPEGGLSDNEIRQAKNEHFLSLNLGPRILRTETATIAAISILQYAYGDFA